MVRLIGDDEGQWILMSGVTIAVGLIVLALVLNQAMLSGSQSSGAETYFPKNDIRELREESRMEARRMWHETGDSLNFTDASRDYSRRVAAIYASHGQVANVTMTTTDNPNTNISIRVSFSDGTTYYTDSFEVSKP